MNKMQRRAFIGAFFVVFAFLARDKCHKNSDILPDREKTLDNLFQIDKIIIV